MQLEKNISSVTYNKLFQSLEKKITSTVQNTSTYYKLWE